MTTDSSPGPDRRKKSYLGEAKYQALLEQRRKETMTPEERLQRDQERLLREQLDRLRRMPFFNEPECSAALRIGRQGNLTHQELRFLLDKERSQWKKAHRRQLEKEADLRRREQAAERQREQEADRQRHGTDLDAALLTKLNAALEIVTHASGHVYLRRWVMLDGTVWFKVGITNNPNRREAEQNVLPVPMKTIACTDVGSIERARALEAAIHRVLDKQRITGASNRELFHLTDAQAATIKAVIQNLS